MVRQKVKFLLQRHRDTEEILKGTAKQSVGYKKLCGSVSLWLFLSWDFLPDHLHCLFGMLKPTVVPLPTSLSIQISPPNFSTSPLVIARPKPVPSAEEET